MTGWRSAAYGYDANISTLFGGLPLAERPAAAVRLGYQAVETWWPFPAAVPSDREADAFLTALEDAGTTLVSLNLAEGDTAAGDRGLLSLPAAQHAFSDNLDAAVALAGRAGCRILNVLHGNRLAGADPRAQDELALENYCRAVHAAATIGASVVLETLNSHDSPHYPLVALPRTARLLHAIRDATGRANVGLLLDVYHLDRMGDDVPGQIAAHGSDVVHVQIADNPGRGRPGTGRIDFATATAALHDVGYRGWVGLEYLPTAGVSDALPPPPAPTPPAPVPEVPGLPDATRAAAPADSTPTHRRRTA